MLTVGITAPSASRSIISGQTECRSFALPAFRRRHRSSARNEDLASWSIPKGLIAEGGSPLAAAKREFAEETGHRPRGKARPLGEAKQPGGKIVHVWAVEGDWEAARLKSNMFELEWPPRSGRRQKFPELDRAEWFGINVAHAKILKGQAVFLDRLLSAIVNG
ncbi:NUDIX domain-containing protein [Bradyrhizobium sp. SRL28]|nr:NUDIX domain-containing protein [Bradyrhizobium sp. SRL28]